MKIAVTEKNTPKFLSFWAGTKNLGLMNWLTKKQAKANKIARESKWKVTGSCDLIWAYTEVISRAADRQKPIIKSAQSMLWMWWCTTTKPASSAGASTGSTASPQDEGFGCCGLNFGMSWSNFGISGRKNSSRVVVILIFCSSRRLWLDLTNRLPSL